MAARGVKPTDGNKRFRGAALTEWIEVVDTPYEGPSPNLPDTVDWPAQTRTWYEVVRHLPHAVLWEEGEWQEILTTALVHAAVWSNPEKPSASTMTELRAREKALGLTADQRRDLRIRYTEPAAPRDEDEPAPVVPPRKGPGTDALET